jgi:hypothetical protein
MLYFLISLHVAGSSSSLQADGANPPWALWSTGPEGGYPKILAVRCMSPSLYPPPLLTLQWQRNQSHEPPTPWSKKDNISCGGE